MGENQQHPQFGPGDLRRSYTQLDFPINRERSFMKQHHTQVRESGGSRRRSSAMPSNRGKPTLEIYRPPNVRTDVIQNGLLSMNARLNVHAKEFTMKQAELATSRSSVHIPSAMNNNNNHHQQQQQHRMSHHMLQPSKSSGNILHQLHHSKSSGNVLHSLQQSYSGTNLLQGPRVHFQLEQAKQASVFEGPPLFRTAPAQDFSSRSAHKSYSVTEMKTVLAEPAGNKVNDVNETVMRLAAMVPPGGLKRSKSLSAADMAGRSGTGFGVAKEAPDLGSFPQEIQASIRRAVEDPNKVSARTLMELVRHIMDRVVASVFYALPAAKLCITIIEKEKKETFLESLLNTCQQWYQERDRILRGGMLSGPAPRVSAFMQFLNEMYCELKRRQLQLKTQYEGVPPELVLLTLLYECCLDCLKPPSSQGETDSLFFVLTSIGRDLEHELPAKLSQLLASVRDAFLTTTSMPAIKKTLLQLIELHAARWQLPAAAVMYYTTQL